MTETEGANIDAKSGDNRFTEYARVLPENCVEYMLFVLEPDLQHGNTASSLEAVRKAAVQLANQLTKDYIWQRDSFNLETKRDQGRAILQTSLPR